MDNMDIRIIEKYDDAIDLIIKLEMSANRMNSNYIDLIISNFKIYFEEQFINKDGVMIGYYKDNKLIGLIGKKDNYIEYLYVEKEYQRKGIGTILLNLFDEDTLYLSSSEEAYQFYKKNNFVNHGEPKILKKFKAYPMKRDKIR